MKSNFDAFNTYYSVGEVPNVVWSTKRAEYVPLNDSDFVSWLEFNDAVPLASISQLIDSLVIYNLNKGEYATTMEKIQSTQAKYKPMLDELISACSTAQMLGDVEDADEIKLEYANLLRQQGEEIAAIQNGGA